MDIKNHATTMIKIADIKTDGDNPNEMDDATKKRLLKSMETWGNTQPIVVDKKTMFLADGEHRLKQYIAAGKKDIPAIIVDFDSDADRRAYRQAANKIRGGHVPERDTAEFQKIIEAGRGELLEIATGMKLGQVEKHMRRYGPSDDELTPEEDGFQVTDDYEPKYDVQLGDEYKLGEHSLICGDATQTEYYTRLTKDQKVDAIITDPPYNLDFRGTSGRFEEMDNDNLDNQAYKDFTKNATEELKGVLAQHGSLYLCIDWRNYPLWFMAIKEQGLDIINTVVLDKIYAGLGNRYRFRHEFIIFAGERNYINWKGGGEDEDVIKLSADTIPNGAPNSKIPLDHKGAVIPLHGTSQYLRIKLEAEPGKRIPVVEGVPPYTFTVKKGNKDDVIENLSMNNFVQRQSEDETGIIHPTMKPITLLSKFLLNSTKQGDKVLDPFGGSGSTLIACEQTKRACFIMELKPEYCSLIIERWEALTGEKAEKVKQ